MVEFLFSVHTVTKAK